MLEDEGANGMEGSVDDMNNTVGLGSKRRRRAQNSPNSPKLQKRTRLNFDHAEDLEMVEDTSTETRHHMASRWGYTTDAAEGPSSDREASNRTSPSTPIRHEASAHRRGKAGRSIYAWVMNPKDEEGHPPHHPDYDPTTLHIPPSVYPTFGHVERQYWDIKRKHWDVILLFEWLRSYVLVGNDAIVAQELLGLPLSSGSRVYLGDPRCAQVPTPTTPYVRTLLKHGYSVAYVETVHDVDDEEDTLFIPDDRSSTTTASGLVRRRMGTILTASTVTDPDLLCSDMPTFCMALRQDEDGQELRFGVTFIDMASGEIYLYGFTDGIALTRLGMLLACTSPTTVVVERKKHVSNDVKRLLIAHTSRVRGCLTVSASLLWKSKHNIALLTQCFTETTWPAVLVEALEQPLVMAALGGLLGQLRRQKILSATMLTRCSYHWYDPNGGTSKLLLYPQTWDGLHLGHDRPTGEYALFRKLDRCATPFGKRLLYRWLCHPLVDSGQINARLDAIDTLYGNKRLVKTLTSMLRSLPDLTRIMSRVRLRSCQAKDVAKAIQGLEHIRALACTLAPSDGKGNPITALVASWPSLDATLERWMEVFDQEEALYANVFIPPTGTYDDYDRSHSALLACIREKDEYLTRIRTELASPAIELRKGTTTDRTRANDYLYIPVNVKIPSTWERYRTKERGRYCPPEGLAIAAALQDAEFAHTTIMQEVARDILDKFDRESTLWTTIIDKVAELDCLLSLAAASESMGVPVCRPTFVEEGRTVVDFQDLRHPFPPDRTTTFVANDILLGGSFAPISLLTGANASGKSTVMRVVCVLPPLMANY